MSRFAFIVDGEVGIVVPFPDEVANGTELPMGLQKTVAVLRSNPKVIEITDKYGEVQEGYTWDGKKFSPPVE